MNQIAALSDTHEAEEAETVPTERITRPDTTVRAREAFGIDVDMDVPAFSVRPEPTRPTASTARPRWRSSRASRSTAG